MIQVHDANTITSNIAYALSDAFFVYPITPSTSASENVEQKQTAQHLNIYKQVPKFGQMQSELGSIAACHGASHANAMASTFTSSQGLLLMQPSILKMVGERKPAVIHVAARSVATHTLSIYGDHADIMQLRSTGAIMMGSANLEECQYNAVLSYLIAETLKVPVIHFYDGFTTSHEAQNYLQISEDDLKGIIDKFRKQFNIDKKPIRTEAGSIGLIANDDLHFQMTEALYKDYKTFPVTIQKLSEFLRAEFKNKNLPSQEIYPTLNQSAKHLIVTMNSSADIVKSYCQNNKDTGLLQINMFRPLSLELLQLKLKEFKNLPDNCQPASPQAYLSLRHQARKYSGV
ncbi:Pyruvate-flavodoxin_oxidoreductase 5 [Hexamita inflata]|uniref:Pyruvate-flavodoxin_oxidoreductase 5 n=1 Tax=Hexamita inflata TaxID=28002 RepID=A0ABP1GEV6_9EUKA